MKRFIPLLIMLCCAIPLFAQHKEHAAKGNHRPEISELVSDLSAQQKRQLDAISKESRQRIDQLRQQKHAVCDSIGALMNLDGDQSATLYVLFEREAALQVAINREMYASKVAIDKVLTAEQRQQLRAAGRKDEPRSNKRR